MGVELEVYIQSARGLHRERMNIYFAEYYKTHLITRGSNLPFINEYLEKTTNTSNLKNLRGNLKMIVIEYNK